MGLRWALSLGGHMEIRNGRARIGDVLQGIKVRQGESLVRRVEPALRYDDVVQGGACPSQVIQSGHVAASTLCVESNNTQVECSKQ